jgi:hypothetical protein
MLPISPIAYNGPGIEHDKEHDKEHGNGPISNYGGDHGSVPGNGSCYDINALKTDIDKITNNDNSNISFIMDNTSAGNIDDFLNHKDKTKFLITLPFTAKFANDMVEKAKRKIYYSKHQIESDNYVIRGMTIKQMDWNEGHKVNVHIYYNPSLNYLERDFIYGYALELKEGILSGRPEEDNFKDALKYLHINDIFKNDKIRVTLREDIIEDELRTKGWMVAISNYITNSKMPLNLYGTKDTFEKSFFRIVNFLELKGLIDPMHSGISIKSVDNLEQNKIFIGFISLILISIIHKISDNNGLYKKFTMLEIIKIIERTNVLSNKGKRFAKPLTDDQKDIFLAFNIPFYEQV